MAVKITCDSSTDLTKEMYEALNVTVLPFDITLGEKVYTDGSNITGDQIIEYVEQNKTLPKTSAINEFTFAEFFKENNTDEGMIFISISSKLSCSCSNAINASQSFDNVYVIDSLSLSTGGGLLVLYACELRDQGLSAKEIAQKLDERKKHIQASFVVDKLDFLHKGGRCSSLALLGANLLKIHPSILLENGSMGMHKKYRGKIEECAKNYTIDTFKEFNTPNTDYCFVTCSCNNPDLINTVKEVVEKNYNFKKVYVTYAGATVVSHCGRNTIGLIYFNDGK